MTKNDSLLNDTVEGASLVSKSLFTSAKGSEVLGSLRDNIGEQLEHDSALGNSTNGNVEENLRVGHVSLLRNCFPN